MLFLVWLHSWSGVGSCALEERGKNDGKTKGGQCLNTLCLRSGDSRTGIFQGILRGAAGELVSGGSE